MLAYPQANLAARLIMHSSDSLLTIHLSVHQIDTTQTLIVKKPKMHALAKMQTGCSESKVAKAVGPSCFAFWEQQDADGNHLP